MEKLATLLAHYRELDNAQRALARLRREGLPRSAIVHRSEEGAPTVTHPSRRNQRFWRLAGGLVIASAAWLAVQRLGGLPLPFGLLVQQGLVAALGFPLGVLLGWLYSRRATPRVDLHLIERYGSLLATDESLLLIQAPLGRLTLAPPVLREFGDPEPAIFPLHPERELNPVELNEPQVALPLSQIEAHARRLAREQMAGPHPGGGELLLDRLDRIREEIRVICGDLGEAARLEQAVGSVAEWILDNEYIVESHVRDVQANLSRSFYRELPAVQSGPDRGLPRIYSMARELVSHTDYRLDRENVNAFLEAYQAAHVLTIGELWALPMMLRIALVEGVQRLAVQAAEELRERKQADYWANRLLVTSRREPNQLFSVMARLSETEPEPSTYFSSQLSSHLYDEEAALVPVQSWLERTRRRSLLEIQQREQARQAGEQVSVANAVTSLRQLSLLDWREVFERHSRVERTLRADPAGLYPQMDFETRNSYREAVEVLARGAQINQVRAAEEAVALARQHAREEGVADRSSHVGSYLIGELRPVLSRRLGCREPWRYRLRQWVERHHTAIYLSTVGSLTGLLATASWVTGLQGRELWIQVLGLALLILPASQLGVDFTNYLVTRLLPPRTLPKLDFESRGIPDPFRTLVTVPVLPNNEEAVRQDLEQLEIRYLANPERNLAFSLFMDYPDADDPETDQDDRLLATAVKGIETLNQRYGHGKFYLFQRGRTWTESEGRYLGWERKRGKLEELNRLISGLPPISEGPLVAVGDPNRLKDFRFVITLDRDTQLLRDSARRMVETLAHPLNQPRITEGGEVDSGSYTIIQPRVSTSLPSATATPFSRLFTIPVGVDPYTKAVSDAYMDLSGEGSYHGKGIYDPRAFERVLGGRFPEQRLLSHDLIEGAHVRVGLASDIELFDDFPEDYLTYTRREHRWIRGDWQIAEWILPSVPSGNGGREPNPLSGLNRWKVFDNLRRSLVAPASLAVLALSWFAGTGLIWTSTALVASVLLFQPLAIPLTWATSRQRFRSVSLDQIRREITRALANAALLPYEAGLALDAIVRVLYRRFISKRRLLEWTSAQMTGWTSREQLPAFLIFLGAISLLSLAMGSVVAVVATGRVLFALPWLLLWILSPLVGWALNRKPAPEPLRQQLGGREERFLRRTARRTWRFFDDFVGPETAWLPPDNYQVSHQNELAMRTSPTNIGMWMLSALGAHDFGYLDPAELLERLGKTAETLSQLDRHQGHPFNWYRLPSLEPLEPRYVSFVDSGNLIGAIWTLAAGIDELKSKPVFGTRALSGAADVLRVLQGELDEEAGVESRRFREIVAEWAEALESASSDAPGQLKLLADLRDQVQRWSSESPLAKGNASEADYWLDQLAGQLSRWQRIEEGYLTWVRPLADWLDAEVLDLPPQVRGQVRGTLADAPSFLDLASGEIKVFEDLRDALAAEAGSDGLELPGPVIDGFQQAQVAAENWLAAADDAVARLQSFADAINLRFLYDEQRRLFAVGYNLAENRLDIAYYDMLASEARLGSFVAIARGEVPIEHWLSLSRPYGSRGRRRMLMSWTGTMFEYLMPHLLQRTFPNSLLEKATREAVQLQIDYGRSNGIPWGISESGFGDLDVNRTYQYRAFGVPWLGLKRGLEEDLVVAPYATLLALPVAPQAAMDNLRRLAEIEMLSDYGYYEAIDYSRRPQPERERGVKVRAYMAHHQGMSFLAIVNLLHDEAMQRRFHMDRRVKAAEPLLFERVPAAPVLHHLPTREELPSRGPAAATEPSVSHFETPHTVTPKVQLLSNGRFSTMVTNAGGGYSRWEGLEINRWRADLTRDNWGTFCYVRDVDSGEVWSSAHHPVGGDLNEYEVRFPLDRAEFVRQDAGIETKTEIIVSPEDDVEIRRLTFANRGLRMRYLELTSYLELSMASHEADRQHPAFNKMFIETEALDGGRVLLAKRRPRAEDEQPIYVAHRLTYTKREEGQRTFESDRRVFIGRGQTLADPIAVSKELSNTSGFVMDPCLSLRGGVRVPAGQSREVSLIIGVGQSREAALNLMEKYTDPSTIERAFELSWASTQLQLRMLRIHPDEARRFQKLAGFLLYPSPLLRPPGERLRENQKGQAGLWPYGISGDHPIVLVSIGDAQDLEIVRQLLQARVYWRQHGLVSDLVILNEESTSYEQPLKERLDRLIQAFSAYDRPDSAGRIFLLNTDHVPAEDVTLLLAAARVTLVAARGPLAQQLGAPTEAPEFPARLEAEEREVEPSAPLPYMDLPYFNSLGGFSEDGREYVIYLGPNSETPAPWINVIANPSFGTIVSESGVGFTWYGNSQRNRLTSWSNDPVIDPASEAIYLRDEETGAVWSPTGRPVRQNAAYRAHHGAGYSTFEHNSLGIESDLTVFVPNDDGGGLPLKISCLRLRNDSARPRRLTVTYYVEWTLGETREESSQHVVTDWDEEAEVLLAHNRYRADYGDRVAFAAINPSASSFSGDRTAFLGRNGRLASPAALRRVSLSGRVGGSMDPMAGLQTEVEIGPGESREIICLLGDAENELQAQDLAGRFREQLAVEEALEATKAWWDSLLGQIHVETPELSVDFLVNRWLLYQSLSCRLWARSAFYQSGGAMGFRDQLQDVLAFLQTKPEFARKQILEAAAHQFAEGDVLHWWHPPSGEGIRSRISDDLLWLPYVTGEYVEATGDKEILEQRIPFLAGPPLEEGEHEVFLRPTPSGDVDTLFEHCRRAVEKGVTSGPHGLPLIGTGDWNDGMNRVGAEGRGESVWLAWFSVEVLRRMADLAAIRGEDGLDEAYRRQADRLLQRIDEEAWDGAWYLRAFFDNGQPLGSSRNNEGWIDSLPQSWSWITGGGDRDRAERALDSAWRHLVRPDERLILLFRPPFEEIEPSPGYIRGYPPGVRENGGQYTHAAIWLAIASARKGDGGAAAEALRLLNPIERAKDAYGLWRYNVEPYVVSADVYRLPGRIGQGGWSWYTGSAAWMYRAWLEEILGVKRRGDTLEIDPTIPSWWEGFSLRYRHGQAVYWIEVSNPESVEHGVATVQMDGREVVGGRIPLETGPIKHRVQVRMGAPDPQE